MSLRSRPAPRARCLPSLSCEPSPFVSHRRTRADAFPTPFCSAVYLSNPEQNVSTGLCFALARIYSLTILLTLNQTPHLVQHGASTGSGRKVGGVGVFSGVEVLHTATVRVDDARETQEGRAIDLI